MKVGTMNKKLFYPSKIEDTFKYAIPLRFVKNIDVPHSNK